MGVGLWGGEDAHVLCLAAPLVISPPPQGGCATILCQPLDVLKTRLMNSKGEYQVSGGWDGRPGRGPHAATVELRGWVTPCPCPGMWMRLSSPSVSCCSQPALEQPLALCVSLKILFDLSRLHAQRGN